MAVLGSAVLAGSALRLLLAVLLMEVWGSRLAVVLLEVWDLRKQTPDQGCTHTGKQQN